MPLPFVPVALMRPALVTVPAIFSKKMPSSLPEMNPDAPFVTTPPAEIRTPMWLAPAMLPWFATVPGAPVMKILLPVMLPEIVPPDKFVTLPPARRERPSTPEIEPVLLTMPGPPSEIPSPPEAATIPAFAMVHVMPAPPSMPSADPVEVTVPVLVMMRGSSEGPRTTGPVVLLLIVLAIGLS
jgi:hypothetical protein